MPLVNLIMAGIWLTLGVCLVAYDHFAPSPGWTFPVGERRVSVAWLPFLLTAYNLLRWWLGRANYRARRQREEPRRGRARANRERDFRESGRERDPNFIFDERTDATP